MNLSKLITYLLAALLVAALGAAGFFYLTSFMPMAEDYDRMKEGMPELVKAKAELKKYKEKENQQAREAAWVKPAVEALVNGLDNEIKAGTAEVVAAGNSVVINIGEQVLFTPESKTFSKDTQTRLKLGALLKKDEFKGKDIFVGNTTEAVAGRGKGKKKVTAKDALTLAFERSTELVKSLVKEGVSQDQIGAVAYSSRQSDRGFKIKNRKTMIVIGTYPPIPEASAQKQEAAPAKPQADADQQSPPKTIPIKPAEPKAP